MAYRRRRLVITVVLGLLALAVAVVPGGAASASVTQPTLTDSVGFWPFDGDTAPTATDYSGFGDHATLHGPAAFSTTSLPALDVGNEQSLTLPSGGYATAPIAAPLATGSQLTIAAWIKVDPASSGILNILSIDGRASIGLDGHFPGSPMSLAEFTSDGGTSSRALVVSGTKTNSWHHIAFTIGAEGMTAYVDGQQVNSVPGVLPLASGTGITFGDSGTGFSGGIDDVRLYDRALTPTEVNRLAFNCGDPNGGTNVATGVSTDECHGLADFYLATNGADWTDSTGWLRSRDICSWNGVLCFNGHVFALVLLSNNLSGTLPLTVFSSFSQLASLGLSGNHLSGAVPLLTTLRALQALDLSNNAFSGFFPNSVGSISTLQSLNLAGNRLTGDVSRTVLGLTGLITLDVQYNGLDPTDADVRNFFTAHEADWAASQTVAPSGLHVTGTTGTTATLAWSPIAYTADGGHYEVVAVDPVTGATTSVGTTADKTATGFTVPGLIAGQPYGFEVRTVTPPHDSQLNTVASEPSALISVTPTALPTTTVVEDTALPIAWTSWTGVTDPGANGGTLRLSQRANATAVLHFTGTSVKWLVRKGPDRGRATVLIDGASKGTVDTYAATPTNATLTYAGLANRAHTLTIKVLGTRRAGATGANVPVDGFLVGSAIAPVQDSSPSVTYDGWTGTTLPSASGGTYRSTAAAGAMSTLAFTGTGVDWVTSRGPSNGRASVSVDGGPATLVDLYRSSASWRVVGRSVSGLAPGGHTIVVRVLGTKNSAATGARVPVDAFVVHG
jgi:hypothetical protein